MPNFLQSLKKNKYLPFIIWLIIVILLLAIYFSIRGKLSDSTDNREQLTLSYPFHSKESFSIKRSSAISITNAPERIELYSITPSISKEDIPNIREVFYLDKKLFSDQNNPEVTEIIDYSENGTFIINSKQSSFTFIASQDEKYDLRNVNETSENFIRRLLERLFYLAPSINIIEDQVVSNGVKITTATIKTENNTPVYLRGYNQNLITIQETSDGFIKYININLFETAKTQYANPTITAISVINCIKENNCLYEYSFKMHDYYMEKVEYSALLGSFMLQNINVNSITPIYIVDLSDENEYLLPTYLVTGTGNGVLSDETELDVNIQLLVNSVTTDLIKEEEIEVIDEGEPIYIP